MSFLSILRSSLHARRTTLQFGTPPSWYVANITPACRQRRLETQNQKFAERPRWPAYTSVLLICCFCRSAESDLCVPDPFTCLPRSYNSCNLNPTLRRGVAHRSRACADMFGFCASSLLLGLKTVTNVHPHIPTLIPPSPTSHKPQSLQHQHAIKHDRNCTLPCTLPTASCRSRCVPLIPCSWTQPRLLTLSHSEKWGVGVRGSPFMSS